MKVALICPPARLRLPDVGVDYSFLDFFQCNLLAPGARETVVGEHLGLGYLASALRLAGHEVEVVDACLEGALRWQDVAARLLAGEPAQLVGFTGSQDVFEENVLIARALRDGGWTGHFVAGQDFCSLNHEVILRTFGEFDSVGRGEGDELIVELAGVVSGGGPLEQIDGLTWRDGASLRVNAARGLICDLDTVAFPNRPGWRLSRASGLAMGMATSRGCGYDRCTFCYPGTFSSVNQPLPGGPWRARSASNVVDEMELLRREYGARRITMVDENYVGFGPAGIERAHRIADELRRRQLDVEYMVNLRSVDVTRELMRSMQASGLSSVFIGLESGTQRVLRYYRKGTSVSAQREVVQLLRELGISLVVGYIFFDPISGIEEIRRSLRFYLDLEQYDVSKFGTRLRVLPGTSLYTEMRRAQTVRGDVWRTDYDLPHPAVETTYALVTGLHRALLPTLLMRRVRRLELAPARARAIMARWEACFFEALTLAEGGLAATDPAVAATIDGWAEELRALLTPAEPA